MPTSASFEIPYVQYLDVDAKPVNDLPAFATDKDALIKLYKDMQFLRMMDLRSVALQRVGKMRTYPASTGQEAVGIGAGSCLGKNDVLVPYYRGTGMMLQKGIKPHEILLYWGGDERGSDYKNPDCKQDFPIAVPIATQILHASGVASAIKLRGQKGRAVMTEIGEGGTSEGEFYEGINVAGAWDLPVVFVINNNQWAISVRPDEQTSCETFAQKGIGAGIESVQVDGNDIIAVRDVVGRAMDKARNGGGPTLVECVTYRLCDHTTADDASRYHDKEVHDKAWEEEPIKRLGTYLKAQGYVTDEQLAEFEAKSKIEVEREVEIYFETITKHPQPPEAMFDYLFAELPERTRAQRDDVIRRGAK